MQIMNDNICNICDEPISNAELQENLLIDRCLGYGSIYDEERHKIRLCHECFDDLIKNCIHPTLVKA